MDANSIAIDSHAYAMTRIDYYFNEITGDAVSEHTIIMFGQRQYIKFNKDQTVT